MNWIGIQNTITVADVHVHAHLRFNEFHLRFNREKCDQLCPNNRRLILGIEGERLYFKEVRNNEGYKYCLRGYENIGTATLHNKNSLLCKWATNMEDEVDFDCELQFDESLRLYYIERPSKKVK